MISCCQELPRLDHILLVDPIWENSAGDFSTNSITDEVTGFKFVNSGHNSWWVSLHAHATPARLKLSCGQACQAELMTLPFAQLSRPYATWLLVYVKPKDALEAAVEAARLASAQTV